MALPPFGRHPGVVVSRWFNDRRPSRTGQLGVVGVTDPLVHTHAGRMRSERVVAAVDRRVDDHASASLGTDTICSLTHSTVPPNLYGPGFSLPRRLATPPQPTPSPA